MRSFTIKAGIFSVVLLAILVGSLFLLPDYVVKTKSVGAVTDKHALLRAASSPKIVFVGGSNVSFGLDSRRVRDSLKMDVVNAGVHAGLGLRFMLNDIKPFVNKGDIIVLMPEYWHFIHQDFYDGKIELVSVLFDVYPEARRNVSLEQWITLSVYLPTYSTTKLKNAILHAIRGEREAPNDIYGRHSFNEFGDTNAHWNLPPLPVEADPKESGHETVVPKVVQDIHALAEFVTGKGATLVMMPPVYQQTSFNNRIRSIDRISKALESNQLGWIASPERYALPDTMFFNTPFHPRKTGVDVRTIRVIEDLRRVIP
ncbi:MAG TPA: hypothetical protein VK508_03505 [Cyclobacteriaceae bacterium]|nr:hypothetical protein [Cyclobacteriaceae bacterium]